MSSLRSILGVCGSFVSCVLCFVDSAKTFPIDFYIVILRCALTLLLHVCLRIVGVLKCLIKKYYAYLI